MASSGMNWLRGCGVGCLVLAALTVALVGGGAWLLKESVGGWKEASERRDALHAALGEVDDFEPDANGSLDPARIEVFLEAQARTEVIRRALGKDLIVIRGEFERARNPLGRLVQAVKIGTGLAPRLAEYTEARARALLDVGMNPGEYLYLHSLIYHCWLGHDPAAGVGELAMAVSSRGGGVQFRMGSDDDLDDGDPEDAARQLRRQIQDRHRGWLQSMLQRAADDGSPAAEAWRASVRGELDRLAVWPEAMPWSTTFPEAWDEVLEPHEAALAAGWSEAGNMVELFGLD